jgi:hypothetical protein
MIKNHATKKKISGSRRKGRGAGLAKPDPTPTPSECSGAPKYNERRCCNGCGTVKKAVKRRLLAPTPEIVREPSFWQKILNFFWNKIS